MGSFHSSHEIPEHSQCTICKETCRQTSRIFVFFISSRIERYGRPDVSLSLSERYTFDVQYILFVTAIGTNPYFLILSKHHTRSLLVTHARLPIFSSLFPTRFSKICIILHIISTVFIYGGGAALLVRLAREFHLAFTWYNILYRQQLYIHHSTSYRRHQSWLNVTRVNSTNGEFIVFEWRSDKMETISRKLDTRVNGEKYYIFSKSHSALAMPQCRRLMRIRSQTRVPMKLNHWWLSLTIRASSP